MCSKSVQEERWAISCATLSLGSWSSMGTPHCGQGHIHASKWPVAQWWWSVSVSLSASAGLLLQHERGHEGSSSRQGRNTNRRILQLCLLLLPCLSLEASMRQIQRRCTSFSWPSTSALRDFTNMQDLDQWESRSVRVRVDLKPGACLPYIVGI